MTKIVFVVVACKSSVTDVLGNRVTNANANSIKIKLLPLTITRVAKINVTKMVVFAKVMLLMYKQRY